MSPRSARYRGFGPFATENRSSRARGVPGPARPPLGAFASVTHARSPRLVAGAAFAVGSRSATTPRNGEARASQTSAPDARRGAITLNWRVRWLGFARVRKRGWLGGARAPSGVRYSGRPATTDGRGIDDRDLRRGPARASRASGRGHPRQA